MDEVNWSLVGSIFAPSIVAIVVVILSAHFAYRQAHDGRNWERKAEAYSEVLGALHEMEEWFTCALDDELLRREVDDATQEARNLAYRDAKKLLGISLAKQVWLLPAKVHERILVMNKRLEVDQTNWFEHIDSGGSEVCRAFAYIAVVARDDMGSPLNSRLA